MAAVKKINGKWRVVEPGTSKLVTNASGTAVDGGGHASAQAAGKQASAIEHSIERRKKRKPLHPSASDSS